MTLLCFFLAVSLTIEHYSLIIGIPNEVVCRINEPGLFRMEIFYSTQDESMAVANDANTVSLDLIPDESLNGTNITCLASTEDNIHYENFITITVTGIHYHAQCSIYFHNDTYDKAKSHVPFMVLLQN